MSLKDRLVSDWKNFPKWYETWAATVGLAGTIAWHRIPVEWQNMLMSSKYAPYAVGLLFILTMVGTLVAQPKLPGAPEQHSDGGQQ